MKNIIKKLPITLLSLILITGHSFEQEENSPIPSTSSEVTAVPKPTRTPTPMK